MPLSPGHVLLAALVLAGSKPSTGVSDGPALSYLKLKEGDACDWVRQPIPSGAPEIVFSFEGPCNVAGMAWSPDARKALLQVDREPEPGFRLWLVDLVKRQSTQLPLDGLPEPKEPGGKAVPVVDKVSFDPQGRPVALVIYALVGLEQPETGPDGKRFIPFEGQRYPVVEGEGDPALVMAYRLEGGSWKRIELKSTSSSFSVLKAARTLQPVASRGWPEVDPSRALPPGDPARKLLSAAYPDMKEGWNEAAGEWRRITTPGGPLYYRMEPEGDGYAPEVPVRWEMGGKLVPVEGVPNTQGTTVSFQLQRDLLLISMPGNLGEQALIFNVRTKKRLLSLEELFAPVLWPLPSKP